MSSPPTIRIHRQASVPLAEQAWLRDALAVADAEGTGRVWVIVPTGKARLGIHDALLGLRPRGAFLPRVEALDTLVTRLARLTGGSGRHLTRAAHRALISHVLLESSEREGVRELSVGRTFPGVTRGLDGLFRALGRHKIWDGAVFRTQLHRYRQGNPRVRDEELVRVYERYRTGVARDGGAFVTENEEIDHVIRRLEAAPSLFRGVRRVVWFGFADLSPLQADLVSAIGLRVPRSDVIVPAMPLDDEDADGAPPPIEVRIADAAARAALRVDSTHDEPAPTTADVTWTSYDDPLREVRSIAAGVRAKLDADTPPQGLAVAFADLDIAIPYVREVFPKYGIPFQAERGVPLTSVPSVGRLLGVLDLVVRRFRRVDLEELARSRAFGRRVRHALDLDRAARAAKIVGGGRTTPDDWRSALGRALDRARGAADESDAPRWKIKERDRIQRAIEAADDLFALIEPLETAMTTPIDAAAFRRVVFALLQDVDGLLPPKRAQESPPARTAAQRDARALHQLLTALEEFCDVLGELGAGRNTLDEWMTRFRSAIADVWVSPMEETQRGVPVVTIHDLRFLPATDVFIGGLTDSAFPRRLRPDLFVPETKDTNRDFLSVPDVAADDLAALERELSQRVRLHLSFPRISRGADQLGAMWATNRAEERGWGPRPDVAADRDPVALRLEHAARRIGRREAPMDEAWSSFMTDPATAAAASRVAHALRVAEARRRYDIGPWTGFVDLPTVSPALAKSFAADGDRVFSISQLQSYAQCPHRWFAAKALRLSELEEVDEDLTPLERGSLAHEIVEAFYRARADDESLEDEAGRRRLAACVEEALAHFPADTLIGAARRAAFTEGLLDDGPRRGMLVRFLDIERERARDGWRVADVEWSFGEGDTRFALDTPFGPVRVTGRIDRIDHHPEHGVLVFDYKTGTPPSGPRDHGRLFQLAVYVDAGRGSHPALARESWDAAYYALGVKDDAFGPRKSLGEARDLQDALTEVRAQIGRIVASAAGGAFPLTVMDDVGQAPCKYCAFQDLCRVRESRLDRRVEALEAAVDRVYVPTPPDQRGPE
jgi:RecB family exonuclease